MIPAPVSSWQLQDNQSIYPPCPSNNAFYIRKNKWAPSYV